MNESPGQTPPNGVPELSIVTSLYKSARFVAPFHDEACRVAASMGVTFELVLVNDGSPDDSLEEALRIRRDDPRVKILDLSRNFGQHRALMTGFAHASGRLVYVTDVDLEEPMDFLVDCHERMKRGDCDVVYGYQQRRKGAWLERTGGALFWRLFNLLCSTKLTPNLVTARLMTRRYVSSLLQHRERDAFLAGLWALSGYAQCALPIEKSSSGTSSYDPLKRLSQAAVSITSFSSRPLLLSTFLGAFICTLALLAVVFLMARWLLFGNAVEGWTSLIITVSFMGGMNLLFVGLVGLYVSRIFNEVKQRPYTLVREVYGDTGQGAGARQNVGSSADCP
jgi:putative glycosyltransferase